MDVVMSVVVTLLAGAAFLVTLLIALSTQWFTARVPSGPDAMALAGPMLAGVGAWLGMVAATWVCVGRGGFDWVSGRAMVPLVVASVMVLGVGLVGAWGFMAWGEKWKWGAWASVVATFLMPAMFQGLLVWGVWADPALVRGSWAPRVAAIVLVPGVVGGLAFGAWALAVHVRASNARVEQERVEAEARWAEHERRDALSRVERVREDLERMPPATPFWNVSMMLVGEEDGAARALIVARARLVPGFEEDLRSTAACEHASLRGGAVEFIRRDPGREAAWAGLVAGAMDLLAADVARVGGLESGGCDLAAEVERLVAAAGVYPGVDFTGNMAGLRAAVAGVPESPLRERAMGAMAGERGVR